MEKRLKLQAMLEEIANTRNVYFQPPESKAIEYPAIIYGLSSIVNNHADNLVYKQSKTYSLTVIDRDPDSELVDKISKLPTCRFDRHFTSDNLNHYVFTIIY